MEKALFAGVDIGSSFTKVVVIDSQGEIKGSSVRRSGTDFNKSADICLGESLEQAGSGIGAVRYCVSTGYGRKNVSLANETRTEIGCHGRGCYNAFPEQITIIDIGGQDNKVISLDGNGNRLSFKMNRKCAAGTGAFLEEMSGRLDVPISEFNALAMKSDATVTINSFCTVFAGTEVLEYIRDGKKVQDIVKGLFVSVVKRVIEMDNLSGKIIMTGGVVAHNPEIVRIASDLIKAEIFVPPMPQMTGALGAALIAREENFKMNKTLTAEAEICC
jgi:predicted CoA-substrate-specific enzyme activase